MDHLKRGFPKLRRTLGAALFVSAAFATLARAQAPHPDQPPRVVIVSGEGEVTAAPDRAQLSLAVFAVAAELRTAETQVNGIVRAYVTEARKLGASDAQISTASLSIQPEYVWDERSRRQKLTGYRVRREIRIVVTDLDRIGDFLLRATQAGVNQVQAPQLESSKAAELRRQALAKAAEDARANAELLATTLDARLGAVRTIHASEIAAPPPVPFKAMVMRANAAEESGGNEEMGFQAGEIRFSATLQVEFDLTVD